MLVFIGAIIAGLFWFLVGWSVVTAVLLTIGIVGYLDTGHFAFVIIGLVGFIMATLVG